MIVCRRCGYENEDTDTFCGSCASFLEWDGQRVSNPAPSPPETEPEPVAEARPGLVERVKEAVGLRGDEPGPADAALGEITAPAGQGTPAPATQPAATPAAATPAAATPAAATPAAATPVPAPPSAAPPSGPTAEPTQPSPGFLPPAGSPPSAVPPAAVKPAATRARPAPAKKSPPSRTINPGDRICPDCGEGNDPARRFCRRCGASIVEATFFRVPWYKRLAGVLRPSRHKPAGYRPARRRPVFGGGGLRGVGRVVAAVLAIAVVAFAVLANVGPWEKPIRHRLSTWYHDVANTVHPSYVQVEPFSASATNQAPGHPASNAIDGASNTYWATDAPNDGIGQSLTVNLQAPTNIDEIGFLLGDTDSPQAYVTQPRPQMVRVAFNGTEPYVRDITLKDTPSFQTYGVKARGATAVTITIESVYASSQGHDTSVTEVELFRKSGS